MKKVFKFFLGLASLAAVAAGAYCVYKNFIEKNDFDSTDDFDEVDDDFEDDGKADSREYVSINITSEETPDEETVADPADDTADSEPVTDPANE